ncbi:MAG TPA: TIGR04282 family arsenosugar biosynthesis glycosyltransferase [Terriglobales bacterium]|nr:TIGR04282 family arsenosugar biosynthesis glycosyltransferase [Terriglobales bacterium]
MESAQPYARTLVVMAKAPRPGLVKTRLIESLPEEAVTAFYRCLLDDTIALARSLTAVKVAVMCPHSDVGDLTGMMGNGIQVVAQQGEGLAAGLTSVFGHFAGRKQSVIAFNSDSPHLPKTVLEDAFDTLASRDLVVGPTDDGGYYLVGAKSSHPTLFAGDNMGTTSALESLLMRARKLNLSVGFTDLFYDVDVAADLLRLAAELKLVPGRAPRTAGWLKQWGTIVAKLRADTTDL